MRRIVVPLVVVVVMMGVGGGPAPVAGQIMGDVPDIRAIVPGEAAPGQLFTIQCFSCYDPAHPDLTEVRLTEQATGKTVLGVIELAPSSGEMIYARAPAGLAGGTWHVRIRILGGSTSGPVGLRLRSKPGTPVPMGITDPANPTVHLTQVRRGQTVGIPAYGLITDFNGIVAVWTQAIQLLAEPRPDPVVGLTMNPTLGTVAHAMVPTVLKPGAALVQLKLTISGVASDLSYALRVQVIE